MGPVLLYVWVETLSSIVFCALEGIYSAQMTTSTLALPTPEGNGMPT